MSPQIDKNDPSSSPTGIKNKPTGVKRLNKVPLIFSIFIIFVIIASLMYALNERSKRNKSIEKKEVPIQESDPSSKIEAWEAQNKEKPKITRKQKIEEKKSKVPVLTEKVVDRDLEAAKKRAYQRKLSAMRSPIAIQVKSSETNNAFTPKSTTLPHLKMDKNIKSLTDVNEKFIEENKKSFTYLPFLKMDPVSPFELKTGSLIPSVMISGINSELPGSMVAQVRENVYDSDTGQYLLIPQGTKLIGKYSSNISYGQKRALIVWQRLLFPSGKTLNIQNMEGVDQEGYAGFEDQVDNHYFKLFGSAFLISLISGELSFSNGKISINQSGSTNGTTTVSSTGEKLLQKNLAVAPTIKIRPGYKFNVFVKQDMILEPLNILNN